MEKESTITFPQGYQKYTSTEYNGCARSKKHRITCWALLLVFTGLVAYLLVSLSCLKTEVDLLKKQVALMEKKAQLKDEEMAYLKYFFFGELNDIERAQSPNDQLLPSNFEDATEKDDDAPVEKEEAYDDSDEWNDANYNNNEESDDVEEEKSDLALKKKREIRKYNDSSFEKEFKNFLRNHSGDDSSSNETSSSVEKSSWEWTSKEKMLTGAYGPSTRKPHSHRKHRKSRIGSAERFFTETHSTTSTPIQVRQSRTKPTQLHGIDKTIWLQSQKFQQHTSPHKDTITKEEALRKGYSRRSEEIINEKETSKEHNSDALTYNMITIHFSADTSHYSRERDPHYSGNGRMQIKSDVYKDWKPAHWTQGIGMSKYFHLHQGRVTVSTTGIYLIYAQIQYSNVQEVNGFSVFRNKEVVAQCITTSTHPDRQEIKSNTCGISTTILLQSNDSICIKDLHHGRYVVLTPEKSYFGLVLLSPFKK